MQDDLPTVDGVTFRLLPGWIGYAVGDDGSVWSRWKRVGGRRPAALSHEWAKLGGTVNAHGRPVVKLQPGGKVCFVHRLVLETFVGPRPDGTECCHADGNPLNNRLANLRWDTRKANAADRVRHGRSHRPRPEVTKYPDELVRSLRARYAAGGISYAKLAAEYGMPTSTVASICNGSHRKYV